MKKVALISFLLIFSSTLFANKLVNHGNKAGSFYILSKFTVCNELSYPVFFTAWALDRPNAYKWADWIQPSDCRTDQFDKYYDLALYEFATGPFDAPFSNRMLREGETFTLSPFKK